MSFPTSPELSSFSQIELTLNRVHLGAFPTPIEPLSLPGGTAWIKRDDQSADLYGGNKVRKLEFLLGRNRGPVITFGGIGSHHVLATTLFAHKVDRPCIGVLVPQPQTKHTDEVHALLEAHCDQLLLLPTVLHPIGAKANLANPLKTIRNLRDVTIIPPGGSTPAGTLGYLLAALEIRNQLSKETIPAPDEVWVPLGTGGTAAGLALGFAMAGMTTRVVAVRVASSLTGNEAYLRLLAGMTFRMLQAHGQQGTMPHLRLRVEHSYCGPGYGVETEEGRKAIATAGSRGIELEGTYTGKCMAAFTQAVKYGNPKKIRMFLDTYGPIGKLPGIADANNRRERVNHEG